MRLGVCRNKIFLELLTLYISGIESLRFFCVNFAMQMLVALHDVPVFAIQVAQTEWLKCIEFLSFPDSLFFLCKTFWDKQSNILDMEVKNWA